MKIILMTFLTVLVALSMFAAPGFALGAAPRTVSGNVTAVSPEAIVVDVGSGKNALDVGAIVQPDTKLTVSGKNASVADLAGQVKVGDTITLTYLVTDNLYAEKITKR